MFEEFDVGSRIPTLMRADFPEPLTIFLSCVDSALQIQQLI
jgi:hypothetical protein